MTGDLARHRPQTLGIILGAFASKSDLLLRARDNGAGQDALELLESFPDDAEFESLADVIRAYGSDQVPQTGIGDVKP
jgi:hypothetical protein